MLCISDSQSAIGAWPDQLWALDSWIPARLQQFVGDDYCPLVEKRLHSSAPIKAAEARASRLLPLIFTSVPQQQLLCLVATLVRTGRELGRDKWDMETPSPSFLPALLRAAVSQSVSSG